MNTRLPIRFLACAGAALLATTVVALGPARGDEKPPVGPLLER
jgi:hypothetical protein